VNLSGLVAPLLFEAGGLAGELVFSNQQALEFSMILLFPATANFGTVLILGELWTVMLRQFTSALEC
jgi:hypothetical protein